MEQSVECGKISMNLSDKFKTLAWVVSGIILSIKQEIVTTTSWEQLGTPWFVLTALAGACYGLSAYWSKSPVPVAGEKNKDETNLDSKDNQEN